MKKIVLSLALWVSMWANAQQNTLLNGNFWKEKPSIETVKAEINKGSNPADANAGNHDVVSIAINNDAPLEVITYLMDQPGNSIDKQTHDGRLYIHWAANKGNVALVKYLLEKGSDIHATDDKEATPLSFAAGNGQLNIEIYEMLFNAGVKPTQRYKDGATLLHLVSAFDKNSLVANYLQSKGLSLKDIDDKNRTVFDYACRMGNVDILNNLLEKGVKPTNQALFFAAQGTRFASPKIETYQYLVEKINLNPLATNDNQETVLHLLVKKKDQREIVQYFLDKKIDVNAQDKNGNTVFANAMHSKDYGLVKSLVPYVKDINTANRKGETALYSAFQNGTTHIAEMLMSIGADKNIISKNGNLAFALIQSYKKPRPNENNKDFEDKIRVLDLSKVPFNETHNGISLYHLAVVKDDLDLLKLLEDKNIDLNLQDDNGMTALHKAASMTKNVEVLKYLVSIGSNKKIKTEMDETAYDLAMENELLQAQKADLSFLK
ncbi:ankyrin repeat domain-containing protein [Capnocytophaga sp. ARDL2]|uniref:ankyrin repeat domain-containing protein n=1 Tax=Capnocytophaga sp. ARDL2 TaxID=3238809 RepID=UPI0035568E07